MTTNDIRTTLQKASARYLLVTLSISQWWDWVPDAKLTSEMTKTTGCEDGAVSVRKKLMDLNTEIRTVRRIIRAMYRFHEKNTKSWAGNKTGITTARKFLEIYIPGMADLQSELDRATKKLVSKWPEFVAAEADRLKGAFNIDDYPPAEEISRKFSVRVHTDTVPSGDFRLDVPTDVVDKLECMFQDSMRDRIEQVERDALLATYEQLKNLRKICLKDDPQAIRNALLLNLEERVCDLDDMNITQSPELASIVGKCRDLLKDRNRDLLASDDAERMKVANEATKTINFIDALLGGDQ